ncbi:hypothetical protein [Sphingomonas sp. M1-B02]|uniref:hypothetical protein n=1 Tax=Sphingomonas sp. M1-B02 TaxID=3114300 RepID=UPI00223F0B57|nr:hypothetical protein [Sphingomonas sp. S6-11]UZK65607.1 hypothetical protein OKW87_13970 [Sphingomonas sp. S6-11]
MLPGRPSRIFRSRWAALLWAAGILWTAITVIGFGSSTPDVPPETALTDDSGAEVSNADLAVLRNFLSE